jgi:tetratricopeptide (TPR) repeat protein
MLFPDAQRVLQALSGFVGGGPLEGIEQVSVELDVMHAEVLDLLGQLVDRSLVVVERSEDGRPRYRLLESIRAFAVQRADEEGRRATIRAAHASWVREIGMNAARRLSGPESNSWEEQHRSLSTVRAQRANFDAAIEWLCVHRPAEALELTSSLFWGWLILGDGAAGATRIERALDAARHVADARSRSLALARTAQLLARVGNVPRAVELTVQALATMPADHATHRAEVESIVGRVYVHAGRFDEGTDLVRRSYAVMCELGDQWSMGMAQLTLGFAAQLCGETEEGERVSRLALDILGRSIDAWLTHAGHRLLGVLGMTKGHFGLASEHLEVALDIARQMDFRVDEAQTMARVGRLHRLRGDERASIDAFEQALLLSREAGDTPSAELVRSQLASIHRAAGDLDLARRIIQRDSPIAEFPRQSSGLPSHRLVQLGALALDEGHTDQARLILEEAVILADDESDPIQRVLSRDALAVALDAGGAADAATALRVEAEALAVVAAPHLDRVERVDLPGVRAAHPGGGPASVTGVRSTPPSTTILPRITSHAHRDQTSN